MIYPRLNVLPPWLGFCFASPKRQTSYVYLEVEGLVLMKRSTEYAHNSLSGVLLQTRSVKLLPLALSTEPFGIEDVFHVLLCTLLVALEVVELVLCISQSLASFRRICSGCERTNVTQIEGTNQQQHLVKVSRYPISRAAR